jgi:chaperonin cofactor prefoldin
VQLIAQEELMATVESIEMRIKRLQEQAEAIKAKQSSATLTAFVT